ncbi:MAG: hypothetical protein AABW51_03010 [Nanoarchaeota archaeon]
MGKEDIIGGIKIALSKGQKLEDIMQSFYNAGYKKEDIERAVSELFSETAQSQQPQLLQFSQKINQPLTQQKTITPLQQSAVITNQQKIVQPSLFQTPLYSRPINTIPSSQTQLQPPKQLIQQQISPSPQNGQERDTQSPPTSEEIQRRYQYLAPSTPTSKQVVSNYSKKNKTDPVTVILITVLALLLGILASIFIFRTQIVEFLNKLL